MTPTIADLCGIKGVTPQVAALILAVVRGDVNHLAPPYERAFPETRAWWIGCHHTPRSYEVKEQAVGELLGTTFEALEVESAPTDTFEGINVGRFVAGYANLGDPYVATLVHCYRDLGDEFEEGGWYICGWADVLEAAEACYGKEV